jgi:hypothetical protein
MGHLFSWAVDGFGKKYYFCRYCEIQFNVNSIEEIKHYCSKLKPKYNNRDKIDG